MTTLDGFAVRLFSVMYGGRGDRILTAEEEDALRRLVDLFGTKEAKDALRREAGR